MNRRRGHAVVAAAALPLCLVATAAVATPALAARRPVSEEISGTLVSINTRSHRMVFTDRRPVKYDRNDLIIFQHGYEFYEEPQGDAEPTITCDLWDAGNEVDAARYIKRGITLTVTGTEHRSPRAVSGFIVFANTCDGVVDEDDEH